eukprot:4164666-Pyramimonas_sp.AAC.1
MAVLSPRLLRIEVYKGKLIMYGCGDLINDYEGIRGMQGQVSRLVRRENMPTLPASDWSVVRICLRFLRPIGPS